MNILLLLTGAVAAYEGTIYAKEAGERHEMYNLARAYADSTGKPLLVVGMKRHTWEPDNGDVTVDIDPVVEDIPGGVWADVTNLPFVDKEFGACYVPHVLEHLKDLVAVRQAVNECVRVADRTYFLCPSPYSIYATFFAPAHNFRIWFDEASGEIKVDDNKYRTGFGYNSGDTSHQPPVRQHFVTSTAPAVVRIGGGYIIG